MRNNGGAAPLLTIVTIVLNERENLARTMANVGAALVAGCEYIVVDGGSSDGIDTLLATATAVDRWVSEPDRGIYDAMNKGVAMSRGDWICFMNAGDLFADSDILADILPLLDAETTDIVYGDAIVRYQDGMTRTWRGRPPDTLPYGVICSHQAVIARRALLERFSFDVGRQASDFEFLVRAWRDGARFRHVPRDVASIAAGGVSDRNRLRSVRECRQIVREHVPPSRQVALFHAWVIGRTLLSVALLGILPHGVVRIARRVLHGAS